MKRAGYREAVGLIAENDEPGLMAEDEIVGMASVLVIAELFGVTQERVARDVARYRRKETDALAAANTARLALAAFKGGAL